MRQTLYLHIGMGKTGTTALQNFFAEQAKPLAAAGITYPKLCQVANAHHLASPHRPPFLDGTGWKFQEPEQFAPALARKGAPAYLMSSELIAWVPEERVGPYCAAIQQHLDLKIVMYLRRQDNIIMAGYNQQIKAGTQKRDIKAVIEQQLSRFDYLAKIKPWEAAVGAENMIIRPYERQQFTDGDLRKDFLTAVLGIEDLSGFEFSHKPNSNPRYARAAMEYKRFLNCLFQDVQDSGAFNELLLNYSAQASSSATEVFTEHDTLDAETRRFVLKHFAADNETIARTYMGRENGVLFSDQSIADIGEVPPIDEAEFHAITDLIRTKEKRLYGKLLTRIRQVADAEQFIIAQARNVLTRSLGHAGRAEL